MYKIVYDNHEILLLIDKFSSDNIDIIKDTAQRLVEELSMGRVILKSMQKQVINILNAIMRNPKYKSIYKWIYKCVCYYSDEESESILKQNFIREEDSECRVWIISAISSRYKEEDLLMINLNELREQTNAPELEHNKLFYAISLFSKLPIKKISRQYAQDIINNKDIDGMIWLTKLYAFPLQARCRGLDNLVDDEIISLMSYSSNVQVQLYTYWSMVKHNSVHLIMPDDINNKSLSSDALKWYYYGMVAGQFIKGNFDYVINVIYLCIYNYHNDLRIKQGVINALLSLRYENCLDKAIVSWFYSEKNTEIRLALIEYMVKHAKNNSQSENRKCGTFFEIIKDEYDNCNYKTYIYAYVLVYRTLCFINNKLMVEYDNPLMEEEKKNMACGSVNYIMESNIFGGQFGGEKNQQYNVSGYDKELETLLDGFIKVCSDSKLCDECGEIKKFYNMPVFKDRVNRLVTNISSWLTIATVTPSVIDSAKRLIDYLTSKY